ncbi:MAG: hypothetical protein ACR2LX_15225 [Jatrophihabitans sp.]
MTERVAVFFDYENVHRTGHGLYTNYGTPLYNTVVDPRALAERIVERRRFASELADVHVFRGRPLPQFQPEAAARTISSPTRGRLTGYTSFAAT